MRFGIMIYLSVFPHICAVLICICFLTYFFRVSLVEILPVFACMLTLVLYALAMLHHLSWIDGIEALAVIAFAIWFASRTKEVRRNYLETCLKNMTHPSFWAALLLLLAIAVCTPGKVVTWWDDINFWATDVKALYYLDGFAGKYGNAASEFGDYPPGAQLIKWWFLHLNPHAFSEGLAFVGYYTMNMVFLLPLLRKLKGRNVFVLILMSAALWLFPGIAEVYGYDGFCADLTMACIYGGFLLAVTDREEKSEIFYYGRLALYLSVLVLTKSMGFVWAMFGLVFFALCRPWVNIKTECSGDSIIRIGSKWKSVSVAVPPIITGGSWMLFCLLMRRVTRTTATAVKYLTTDEYGISGYRSEFARAFATAFVSSPLHKEKSFFVDFTPLGLYLFLVLLVVLFIKARVLPARMGRIVLWFSMLSGVIYYAVIFVAHITIFATETQYLEASGMISSIERYGAPFTVGTLIFLAGVWIDGGERFFDRTSIPGFVQKYGTYLCLILFVALTACPRIGYDGLVGYRNVVADRLNERASMIEEDEEQFLDAISVLGTKNGTRVCYIRRGDVPRWVNNSYLAYEASPVSVVYKSVNLADAPTDWMVEEIRSTHASYLYVEETDADAGTVFDAITQQGGFSCGVLYIITDDGKRMQLTPVS